MLGLSKARRWKNINHSDIQWFRRARECRVCKHRFTTAEINEELLNEIVELRERLAERNANMSQELLELQKRLAEQNKELFNQYSGHFFERFHKAFRVYGSRIELFFQS